MARKPRLNLVGIPQHIIQRGNNRQACFASDEDMAAYMHWLHESADEYGVQIHAWVLMTNHIHLLATPTEADAVSKMMQRLGRYYVRYFNQSYGRSGTLWEGRFKSCLVSDDDYFLLCQRYIELNPVRANMVTDPANYVWSSYRSNALGLRSNIRVPHYLYLALGNTEQERLINYRSLFLCHVEEQLITEIRNAINQGLVLGTEKFKSDVAAMTGRPVTLLKRGPKLKI